MADFQEPKTVYPDDTKSITADKKRMVVDQNYDEGDFEGNGDVGPNQCFTKGLLHNEEGKVEKRAWKAMAKAIRSRDASDWTNVPLAGNLLLANPLASYSFEMEGAPPSAIGLPPSPPLSSPESAADIVECYELMLARDIPFSEYQDHKKVKRACRRMAHLTGYFGPLRHGNITPDVIFRGNSGGDLMGPYLSQFLLLSFDVVNTPFEQRYRHAAAGTDFMSTWETALACQNGTVLESRPKLCRVPKYIRTGRDLAWYTHDDWSFEPYLNAACIMKKLSVPFSRSNPYFQRGMCNQASGTTFGFDDTIGTLAKAACLAKKAASYHKWVVHQKLRPEAIGMMIDQVLRTDDNPQNLHKDLLDSKTMDVVLRKNDNLLLTQVYPEGAPCTPAYPSSHATIAGACGTILKAFYDECHLLSRIFVPDEEGAELVELNTQKKLTVGAEIDKLVSNIAFGRNFAGVAYRSDSLAGIQLGERVAIRLLESMIHKYQEPHAKFRFHLRDGTEVLIKKD